MIINRLAEGIRRQDWFVVTVEILIVVIGIFIGLQVDDWNKARQDRILERQYLERVYFDLNETIKDFYVNWTWDRDRLRSQQFVLDSLRAGVLDPDRRADFDAGLAFAGTHNPISSRWGTINELLSTGNIVLISDLEIRDSISQLQGSYDRSQVIINRALATAAEMREALARHFDIIGFDHSRDNSAVELDYDFEALVHNPEVRNLMSTLQINSDIAVSFIISHMRDVGRFRDSLGEKLGKDMSQVQHVDFGVTDLYERPLPNFDQQHDHE